MSPTSRGCPAGAVPLAHSGDPCIAGGVAGDLGQRLQEQGACDAHAVARARVMVASMGEKSSAAGQDARSRRRRPVTERSVAGARFGGGHSAVGDAERAK